MTTLVRAVILCALVGMGAVAYWIWGPTPSERLAVLLDERRWPEAEALARDALEDAPSEARADFYRALGIALGRQAEHADAIAAYQAAYALRPTDHDLRHRAAIEMIGVGRQLDERGESDAALARYREAVALAPEIPHGHHALIASLRNQGQRDEAIAALNAGLEWGPSDVHLGLQLAWLLATHPDADRRDAERAIELASDVFLHDRTPETLDTMAVALAARGEFEDAIQYEFEAIELAGGKEAPGFEERLGRLESFRAGRPYLEGRLAPAK